MWPVQGNNNMEIRFFLNCLVKCSNDKINDIFAITKQREVIITFFSDKVICAVVHTHCRVHIAGQIFREFLSI